MPRLFSILTAGAVALTTCGSAFAASDITVAAIATGRLYVLGSTEHPHTTVLLDGQFRTESDERGSFQYELVYHPARCIVSATIDGKAHEAVVSNCGQQAQSGSPQNTGTAFAPPIPPRRPAPAARRAATPTSAETARSATPSDPAEQTPAATPANGKPAAARPAVPPVDQRRRRTQTAQPPAPPARPNAGLDGRPQTQPARAPQRSRSKPDPEPDDQDVPPQD